MNSTVSFQYLNFPDEPSAPYKVVNSAHFFQLQAKIRSKPQNNDFLIYRRILQSMVGHNIVRHSSQ